MDFRVELESFRGPLDLLLYLVGKHEVEITDIPVALITDQYLGYLEVLEQLDINAVGDFLELASTLTEIKSRLVLPRGGEIEEELEDLRHELVQQLLEYKKFKDAASLLEERAAAWHSQFARTADDRAGYTHDPASDPIREVELWDLISEFGNVMREHHVGASSSIVYDDTPIQVYMAHPTSLVERGRLLFSEMFRPGMHKSTLVGIFLAILELARHHGIRTEQDRLFGEIWVTPGDNPAAALDLSVVDDYDPHRHAGEAAAGPVSEMPTESANGEGVDTGPPSARPR